MNKSDGNPLFTYPPAQHPDVFSASNYLARLDDLARLTLRLLHGVPVERLAYRDRQRLNRTVSKLLAGVSRTEMLIEIEGSSEKV